MFLREVSSIGPSLVSFFMLACQILTDADTHPPPPPSCDV